MFKEVYEKIEVGFSPSEDAKCAAENKQKKRHFYLWIIVSLQKVNERWNSLVAPSDKLYSWDPRSTYIKSPPFFDGLVNTPSDDLHALIYTP